MSYHQSEEAGYKTGGLLETEAQRLQREADEYTKMLEHERKYELSIPYLPIGAISSWKINASRCKWSSMRRKTRSRR